MGFAFTLLYTRWPELEADVELESMVSRESAFLFNNLALVGIAFSVLWGTLFPILSELVRGTKITVGPPFFNRVNIPLGLFLGWLGSKPAEGAYVAMAQVGTFYYFAFFLLILPILGLVEKPLPVPDTISSPVLSHRQHVIGDVITARNRVEHPRNLVRLLVQSGSAHAPSLTWVIAPSALNPCWLGPMTCQHVSATRSLPVLLDT